MASASSVFNRPPTPSDEDEPQPQQELTLSDILEGKEFYETSASRISIDFTMAEVREHFSDFCFARPDLMAAMHRRTALFSSGMDFYYKNEADLLLKHSKTQPDLRVEFAKYFFRLDRSPIIRFRLAYRDPELINTDIISNLASFFSEEDLQTEDTLLGDELAQNVCETDILNVPATKYTLQINLYSLGQLVETDIENCKNEFYYISYTDHLLLSGINDELCGMSGVEAKPIILEYLTSLAIADSKKYIIYYHANLDEYDYLKRAGFIQGQDPKVFVKVLPD